MRELIYNCYTNGILIKTTKDYKEAVNWRGEGRYNTTEIELVDVPEKVESEKETNKRLEGIARRRTCIKAKKAVVG